jgi:NAD(P)-dependent dehydrogenase (short-subunit alcohol dehydrogenase family)
MFDEISKGATMVGRLDQRVALVIGGGAAGPGWGNGKAAAVLMAREGARVAVADRDLAAAEETCRLIAEEGGEAIAVACDAGRAEDLAQAVKSCADSFGQLDILLNNVGISGGGSGLFAHDEAVWDQVFAVNVRSIFTAARHAVPLMVERGYGRIVNVSSTAGLRVMGGAISHAYGASKAAVIQLTRTLALEFADRGVRCNCVVPGMIDTPHASGALRRVYGDDKAEQVISRRHAVSPTGAQGTPWDIAHAVLYLASPEAAYVNGASLVVDGGLTWDTPHW